MVVPRMIYELVISHKCGTHSYTWLYSVTRVVVHRAIHVAYIHICGCTVMHVVSHGVKHVAVYRVEHVSTQS
jgi:hypothetical protein